MKIKGQDKNDLLPISTNLLVPSRTCLQESLNEQYLLEEFREEENATRKLVTCLGIDVTPELQAILRKENIELDLSYAPSNFFLKETIEFIPYLLLPTSLVSLNLFGTKIGESGSIGLANVLKVTSSLTYLKISYNDMGYTGELALSEGLAVCHSLTALDLSNQTRVEDSSYFFDLQLPDINIAQKMVNNCPQGPADRVDSQLLLNYMELAKQYITQPLELFSTIGQHPAIKYFAFGVVGSGACSEFLHSEMLQVKGRVLQDTFSINPGWTNFVQPSPLEVLKGKVEQVNKSMIMKFMKTFMQDSAGYNVEEGVIKFNSKMIAQCIKFTDLLLGSMGKPINLSTEIVEFIGDNYLLFLLTSLRKVSCGSPLEKLSLDVHKNISSYLFDLHLGKGAIDYVDSAEEKEGDDMPIIGEGMDTANAFE